MDSHAGGALQAAGSGWMLPAVIVLLIAAAVVVAWLWMGREHAGDGPAAAPREVDRNLGGQIMAMLHQAGKPLSQIEISLALDVATGTIASAAEELERKGWVTRTWDPVGYTYLVGLSTEDVITAGAG